MFQGRNSPSFPRGVMQTAPPTDSPKNEPIKYKHQRVATELERQDFH